MQYTDDALQNRTPETDILLFTSVTPIHFIKNIFQVKVDKLFQTEASQEP